LKDFEAVKEQIRQRIELADVVSEHVALKRAGANLVGLCPFHKERTPSFSVSPSRQIFKCFGCNAGGDVFTFVQLREGVNFAEAMRILADRAGIDLAPTGGRARSDVPDRADLARVNEWAATLFRKALMEETTGRAARAYLAGRRLSEAISERFGLGLALDDGRWILDRARAERIPERLLIAAGVAQVGLHGETYGVFRGRLMFPIRDTMKRVVGFGGRTLKDDRAKYLNTAQNALFDKGRGLYALDQARTAMEASRRAVVVEGYTDCLAAHQYGVTNTVATLGTAVTDAQIDLLRRWCDELILVMDSDAAGMAAADRAVGVALRHNLTVRIAHVWDGKDPCEFLTEHSGEAFQEVLSGARDALAFKWERTLAAYTDNPSGAGKKEAIRDFVGLVATMARFRTVDVIQQGLIVNQVAKLLGLPPTEAHGLLRSAGASGRADTAGGAGEGRGATEGGPPDAEQSALTMILEVLLNRPDRFADAAGVLRAERFRDPRGARVASRVAELCETQGGFEIGEILNGFEDPQDAAYVTDLYYRGQQRGNLEATLDGSCRRLEQLEPLRSAGADSRELRRLLSAGEAAAADERLARIHRDLSAAHGFSPPGSRPPAPDRGS
jgi:DNA primase